MNQLTPTIERIDKDKMDLGIRICSRLETTWVLHKDFGSQETPF